MGSLLLYKILIAGASLGGGFWMLKKMTAKEAKQTELLEKIEDTIDERVEEDMDDLKRDHLVSKLRKYDLDPGFSERLLKVNNIFKQLDYSHPRAHTFYNTLLPRLLKVKQANKKLSGMEQKDVDTSEMYASLNEWMDQIIENKIDAIEGEAEINAKVITLLTK